MKSGSYLGACLAWLPPAGWHLNLGVRFLLLDEDRDIGERLPDCTWSPLRIPHPHFKAAMKGNFPGFRQLV